MSNPIINDPEMFTLDDVLDEPDARRAARKASNVGAASEQDYMRASKALAEAEREYRRAMSKRIVELKAAGTPSTVCKDVAYGEHEPYPIDDLRYNRDVAAGVLEAAVQRKFRIAADRRSLDALTEWSMKQSLAIHPSVQEPVETTPIGSVRAA